MPQIFGVKTQSKAIKATLVLDPESFRGIVVPNGQPKSKLTIDVSGRVITAEVNSKSLRRCVAAVDAAEPDTFAVVLAGRLEGSCIVEAGIAFQPKAPKPEQQQVAA